MLKKVMLLAAGASAIGLSTGASAAPITYIGSQQVGSTLATYSIVTDGSLGDIGVSHLTSFNVTLADSISTISYSRTPASGTGSDSGTFFATASALTIPFFEQLSLYTNMFNTAGSAVGVLNFNYNTTYAQMADNARTTASLQTMTEPNRTVPFATVAPAVVAAVPEIGTWAMMIVGLGMVGGAMRRRRQDVTTRVQFA